MKNATMVLALVGAVFLATPWLIVYGERYLSAYMKFVDCAVNADRRPKGACRL